MALLLFIIGFTFFVAGLFALGAICSILGLGCLIASAIWCYRIKPLEYQGEEPVYIEPVVQPKKRQAV